MTATGTDEPRPARAPAPPTLAQTLQAATDEQLGELFAQRPDLVRQLPDDFASLAAACSSPPSVRLAWLRLDKLQRQVLEVLASHQKPLSRAALIGLMDPDGQAVEQLDRAVSQLRGLALIWGDDSALRAVSGVASVVGPAPCGLDPADRSGSPRIARYLRRPAELFDELALAPAGARKVLDKLLWGPPRGSVANADRPVSASSARTPIEWLLARDLLVAADRDAVVLPREIALLMREGRYVRHLALPPPPPTKPDAPPISDADQVAGMHALLFTRSVEELLARLDRGEVRLLRSGGIYQRDATDLSRQLRLSPAQTALVADVALGAGLIGPDHESGVWRLSRTADLWRAQPERRRWAGLALAWRSSAAHTALASAPGGEGRMLSEELNAPGIAEVRQTALRLAATVAPGAPVDAARLAESVSWLRPRVAGSDLRAVLAEILADGELIGLLGRACLSRAGRLAADPSVDAAVLAAAVAWPALVDQVLLQADLTATAPGPLTERAQQRLALLADVESSGGGAVYRISAASLNRGLDAGLTAAELLAEFRDLSLTPVPSTLEVLIADVGRRHGSVRVHLAASVLTADDEAALTAAMGDKALARLGLRRVAATVAISGASPADVVAALRASGVAAVTAHEAVPGRSPRVSVRQPVVTEALDAQYLAAAVRSIRAGEAAKAALDGPDRVTRVTPHELVDVLSQAIRDHAPIWLDFADPSGQRKVRMVDPLTLRHGQLTGFDHREQRVVAFPLSRIAGVAVVEPPA